MRPRWRRLHRAVGNLGDQPDDEALHRVRILAKQARYACELAAPVVGDEAAELAAALAGLQDLLGDLHDTAVAETWLRRVVPLSGSEQRFAAGELVAVERAEAATLREAWPAAWNACDRKHLTGWLR